MPSQRKIARRINSIRSTQQITKAMQMVAAAKLRKVQGAVGRSKPYVQALVGVAQAIAEGDPAITRAVFARQEIRSTGIVVITGDRGLSGGYNAAVLRKALEHYRPGDGFVVIGRRGREFLTRRRYDIRAEFTHIPEAPEPKDAKRVAQSLVEFYVTGVFDRILLVYTRFVSRLSQVPTVRQLVPLKGLGLSRELVPGMAAAPGRGEQEGSAAEGVEVFERGDEPGRAGRRAAGGRGEAGPQIRLFEPSAEEVARALLPMYFEGLIYDALVDARVSEFAARVNAMEAATDNAEEMLEQLVLTYNRARQASITQEISEIVGGAEALR